MDRGYNISDEAWKEGEQYVCQPSFSDGSRQFTTGEVLRSGMIAALHSGNERAVNLMKNSTYLTNGLRPNECVKDLCDVWIAFFMGITFFCDYTCCHP